MKPFKFILTLFVLTILASCNSHSNDTDQTVNAVLGDISYFETFKSEPTHDVDESLRITTHLQYVEKLLRNKDVSNLPPKLQENRHKMLDLLHEYWSAGVFPKNYAYPDQRIPCFIDQDGQICAVGYLIEQTAGREVAEQINSKFKYEYLLAMNDQIVDQWILTSGLSKEECAMIQPSYGFYPAPPTTHISPALGLSSAMLCGVNMSFNTINGIQIARGSGSRAVGVLGLLTGAGQITLGALSYPKEEIYYGEPIINVSQRNLSLINIGLGTSTLILSSWNLITNRKPKEKSLTWNIYSFPTPSNTVGLGFNMTKKF